MAVSTYKTVLQKCKIKWITNCVKIFLCIVTYNMVQQFFRVLSSRYHNSYLCLTYLIGSYKVSYFLHFLHYLSSLVYFLIGRSNFYLCESNIKSWLFFAKFWKVIRYRYCTVQWYRYMKKNRTESSENKISEGFLQKNIIWYVPV